MDNKLQAPGPTGKTEKTVAPNAWLWVALAILSVVLAGALGTGIWYFMKGRDTKKAPGAPQVRLVRAERIFLSV